MYKLVQIGYECYGEGIDLQTCYRDALKWLDSTPDNPVPSLEDIFVLTYSGHSNNVNDGDLVFIGSNCDEYNDY